MKSPTPRQHQVMNFIETHLQENGYTPSYREIQDHLGLKSVGTVYNLIQGLKKRGLISNEPGLHHSLKLFSGEAKQSQEIELSLIGTVSPIGITTYSQPQTVAVPSGMVPTTERTYLLRARGDEFRDLGILGGDLLIVEARKEAHEGETVIALFGEEGTRIGRYCRKEELPSEKSNEMHPLFASEELSIFGILLGLLRIY